MYRKKATAILNDVPQFSDFLPLITKVHKAVLKRWDENGFIYFLFFSIIKSKEEVTNVFR